MIGTGGFWVILALGAAWVAWGPARWRDLGLALAAAGLLALEDPLSLGAYCGLAAMAWWTVREPTRAARVGRAAVVALAIGLAGSKWLQSVAEGDAGGPLGLSYLVFRLIHVLVEAGRGNLSVRPGAAEFAHYVLSPAMFSAGPIERWEIFVARKLPGLDRATFAEAAHRLALGLAKKLLIADVLVVNIAGYFHLGGDTPLTLARSPTELWAGTLLCYVRIYVEFSGYSDIAVGAGMLWGRRLMENFNWPIFARTPPDFWRRWHISLAQWCASYVYMPLLGWMRSSIMPLFASFLVMGLWHMVGWNRVGWAAWQTLGVLVHATWARRLGRATPGGWRTRRPWGVASWLLTQTFVTAGYVFAVNGEDQSLTNALRLLARMFGLGVFVSP